MPGGRPKLKAGQKGSYGERFRHRNVLIFALSRELARELDEGNAFEPDGKLAASLRDVQKLYPFDPITGEQFKILLEQIANGVFIKDALRKASIRRVILNRYLREPQLRARFESVRRCYKGFNLLTAESVIDEIANSDVSARQAVEKHAGPGKAPYAAFLTLTARDPAIEAAYFQAKALQATRVREESIGAMDEAKDRESRREIRRRVYHVEVHLAPRRLLKHAQDDSELARARRRAGLKIRRPPEEVNPCE
jgi:hypothetical protein